MNNFPNERGYNTSPNPGGAPRIPARPNPPPTNNVGGTYQPRSSYGAPPEPQYSSQNTFGQPAPRQPPHYQQQQQQPVFQPQPSKRMRAIQSSSERYALTNYVVANSQDFPSYTRYILVDHQFVFSINFEDDFPGGCLGFSKFQRKWINSSLNKEIDVQTWDPSMDGREVYLSTIEVEIGLLVKNNEFRGEFDAKEMGRVFISVFNNQVLTNEQALVLDFKDVRLVAIPKKVELVSSDALMNGMRGPDGQELPSISGFRGVLTQQTQVQFVKAQGFNIKLTGAARNKPAVTLIQPNFKFEDMGIGGLDKEFSNMFRRAFASRIFPPSIVEKMGIQHVKGILLYGPPGTGKTLMAREIGKMLNGREPKIVNGPEVLSKFVGQSEENIRKLFIDAETEYKDKGEDSSLHIIIFDELDAICKQRGSKNDNTGVGDSVVNQLLAKMDGVEQLNNILIIGMTNRKDMIDEALLRPGRMEVHMEIGLPDENGRLQILKIHTHKAMQNNLLGDDVDLIELAALTKNFTGAEINGLVKSATSFAFNRHVKVGTLAGTTGDLENMKIQRADFIGALDEVHAAFGSSEEELDACITNGIIHFSTQIDKILKEGKLRVEQVQHSERTPLVSLLLHGPPGAGKTALAATMAMESQFPFIKLISPETMIGMSEIQKVNAIHRVFQDSYKSPLSVIVMDDIERLLDYTPIGSRFSNTVLQALAVLLKKQPPKGRRLLVLTTTTRRHVLEEMDLMDSFSSEIYVENLRTLEEVNTVVKSLQLFKSDDDRRTAMATLAKSGIEAKLSISIKKVLMTIEKARQDSDLVGRFVSDMSIF
ncbi:transport between ER and Golgi ATPase protein [Entomortierella chlamydospora]|uniref:Vesicular-fusion protein SEC18 n=1 Tax=Entomortierella chlamydospora TaxID=101097 RepID=A0A9P6MRT8_9FUNG|nr:transport between ER and Golgi ATPase protein [Entomortierella chlamydospora]KAG0011012.1 transport between ER and Golgi ATPase protein [Entomortierella chlamydospora]